MSLGTYAFLDNKNLIPLFESMYETQLGGVWSKELALSLPSTMGIESYGWLGGAPSLELMTGEEKAEDGFNKFTHTITNKEYAKAVRFRELDMRRDKLGMIETRLGEMADKAADHWNSLTTTLITSGTTSGFTAYDGVVYFSASHLESGTAQKNLLTATEVPALDVTTATAPTSDEAAKIIQGMIGWQFGLTDDKGDPINGPAREFTFMVGTAALWGPFQTAITAMNLTSGASNPVQGMIANGFKVKCVLNPGLAALTTKVYMFRTDSRVKPFIHQEEVAIDPQMTDTSSDEYKKYRRFLFSIYTSRAAGYGRWQSAFSATLS